MHIKTKSRQPKYPCAVYERGVISTSKAVSCDDCTKTISVDQYDLWVQKNSEFSYMCDNCTITNLPFNSEDFDTDNQNIRLDNSLSIHPELLFKV